MTKVEEVARALCPSPDHIWNSDGQAKAREYFRSQARAAIEAMREPDEAMMEAGLKGAIAGVGGCWRAMIDAALEEKPA